MIYGAAILLGVLSSLHCVGMCGPIALVTPVVRKNLRTELLSRLLYNAGRTTTYVVLGLLAGLIGHQFFTSGIQQWVSIIAGVFIIIMVVFPKLNPENWKVVSRSSWVSKLKKRISRQFKTKTFSSIYSIGLLNGLLPCGMVFMAIAGAITANSFYEGGIYMLLFGLGTWPLMLILTSTWQLITPKFKTQARRFVPILVGLVGVLLIIRGLGLGIPYLSPEIPTDPTLMTECN